MRRRTRYSPLPAARTTGAAQRLFRTQAAASRDPAGADAAAQVDAVLRAPGQPLDTATRAAMEARLGHDFGSVRVHTGTQAAASARAAGALAYTAGSDIVFAEEQYAPQVPAGRRLLAHELTHVVQQQQAPPHLQQRAADEAAPQEEQGSAGPAIVGERLDLTAQAVAAVQSLAEAAVPQAEEAEELLAATRVAAPDAALAHRIVAPDHGSEREASAVGEWVAAGARGPRPAIGRHSNWPTLARQPANAPQPRRRLNLVFIMGTDRRGSENQFYAAAHAYFERMVPHDQLFDDDNHRSLASVFDYLRTLDPRTVAIGNIYLVSHANEDGTLSFALTGSRPGSIGFPQIKDAVANQPDLFTLPKGLLDSRSVIHIKGCNIGRSTAMLDELDKAFGGKGQVTAPTHKQYYDARREPYFEAMRVYYLEYPGLVKKTAAQQVAEFQSKYSFLSEKKWKALLGRSGARRTVLTPLTFTVTGPPGEEARALDEAKKWGDPQLTRPEMYEWRVASKKKQKNGNVVYALAASKTNFTIDKILADEAGKRLEPDESDPFFFGASTFAPAETAPTVSVSPGAMGTAEILQQLEALKRQIGGLASDDDDFRRDLSADRSAFENELRRRRIAIDVKVVKTEDWFGADEVYVQISQGSLRLRTAEVDLKDGQSRTFFLPVSPFLPLRSALDVQVYDADWPDRDDRIVQMAWPPPFALATNRESMDEADYRVQVHFDK